MDPMKNSLIVRDMSGRQRHGTLTSMDPKTDWVNSDGKVALKFTTAGAVVNTGVGIKALTNGPLSVSAWVKRIVVTGGFDSVISERDSSSFNWSLRFQPRLGCLLNGSLTWSSDPQIINVWNQIGFSHVNGVTQVYYNGNVVASSTGLIIPQGAQFVQVGNNGLGQLMNGLIDDASIWMRGLTPQEWKRLALRRGISLEEKSNPAVRFAASSAIENRNYGWAGHV